MKFTQNGWVVMLMTALLAIVVRLALTGPAQIVVAIVLLALAALVYKMTILIDEFRVKFSMGIGIIGDEVAISDIESCRVFDGTIGWGIRYNSREVVYNINSKQAVELSVKGRSRKILIGCDNPEELEEAIRSFMKH
ncbi:MAG: hypothetical protein ACWA6U_14345 [Breznakibacter sp.]